MAKRFEKAREYTKKYGPQLLPCRFCGNTDIRIVSDRTIFPPKDAWCVVCTTDLCDCTDTYTSVREAVRSWNDQQSKGGPRYEG